MTGKIHERARELALVERIERIGEADRRWLQSHLDECSECASFSATLNDAVRAVRLPLVTASSTLVRTTQARVRARAQELQAYSASMRPLWIAVAMVAAWAALTTPIVWTAAAWAGTALRISGAEWGAVFFFAWMAPTLSASLILLGCGQSFARRNAPVRFEEAP